jgi:hypothetical protein
MGGVEKTNCCTKLLWSKEEHRYNRANSAAPCSNFCGKLIIVVRSLALTYYIAALFWGSYILYEDWYFYKLFLFYTLAFGFLAQILLLDNHRKSAKYQYPESWTRDFISHSREHLMWRWATFFS